MIYLFNENWFIAFWQNITQADVTLYATIVIAIATLIYAGLTYWLVKINSTALDEQTRPYVIASLKEIDNRIHLVIENIGQRPAYKVDIDIKP